MFSHIEAMSAVVDQKECFTRPVNETSHGKAAFFLGFELQNFNFVRFGDRLDKILSYSQRIQKDHSIKTHSYNTLMNKLLKNLNLEHSIFLLHQTIFSELKENCFSSAIPVFRIINKNLQNKEV